MLVNLNCAVKLVCIFRSLVSKLFYFHFYKLEAPIHHIRFESLKKIVASPQIKTKRMSFYETLESFHVIELNSSVII